MKRTRVSTCLSSFSRRLVAVPTFLFCPFVSRKALSFSFYLVVIICDITLPITCHVSSFFIYNESGHVVVVVNVKDLYRHALHVSYSNLFLLLILVLFLSIFLVLLLPEFQGFRIILFGNECGHNEAQIQFVEAIVSNLLSYLMNFATILDLFTMICIEICNIDILYSINIRTNLSPATK